MGRAYLVLGGLAAALTFPDAVSDTVRSMMGLEAEVPAGGRVVADIVMEPAGGGRYRVRVGEELTDGGLALGDALNTAWRQAVMAVAPGFARPSIILHAASLARDGAAVLIPGRSGRGKSSLTAWLMQQGYQHLSDDVAAVRPDGAIEAVYGPLFIRADVWPLVERLGLPGQHLDLEGGGRLIQPQSRAQTPAMPIACRLILMPAFSRKAPPGIERLSPARTAMALMEQNHSAPDAADHGLSIALALAGRATTLRLTYGSFGEIEGVLQPLLDRILATGSAGLDAAIAEANQTLTARSAPVQPLAPPPPLSSTTKPLPAATPRLNFKPRLTIGMPTYDDYHGVYFTVQALRMYHPEVMGETEIIILDNNPAGDAAPLLKALDGQGPNIRYIPYTDKSGSAAGKEQIFAEASGSNVLIMDCHVLIVPGALRRLMDYFNARPASGDLLQGPLLYDDMRNISTHWDPTWRGGMYGVWATDERARSPDARPFEIPMCGTGLFAVRKDAWLHFNPKFRGFGGEEGYIHEKYRQAGFKTMCLPFLRWIHRFGRPGGSPYVNSWEDRIHNYYVGHHELGLATGPMEEHFAKLLGPKVFLRIQQQLGYAPPSRVRETA